jgi:hypothetical protein
MMALTWFGWFITASITATLLLPNPLKGQIVLLQLCSSKISAFQKEAQT